MFMKTVSAMAIATALGLAPVVAANAQTSSSPATPPAATEPSAQQAPSTPSTGADSQTTQDQTAPGTATTPGMSGASNNAASETPNTATDSTAPGMGSSSSAANTRDGERVVDGQITMQSEGTYLGSDLINTTVYSSSDEKIGDVNDIIIGTNGMLEGIVVGVGGFLGIGEKDVALKLDQVKMQDQGDNTVKLVVNSTKDELENAPAFKTVAEIRQEGDTTSSATPGAPAAPSATTVPPASNQPAD
mgnify:CR=1 FL=1|jgi:hypothetical protein